MNQKNILTALMVAVVVGSLLNLINSYDIFLAQNFSAKNTLKIILTYITPFCVSLYSSIRATRQKSVSNN
ncbi:MAG: nitrate/nitrite transporter NrtS [Ferruginibacter sp.]